MDTVADEWRSMAQRFKSGRRSVILPHGHRREAFPKPRSLRLSITKETFRIFSLAAYIKVYNNFGAMSDKWRTEKTQKGSLPPHLPADMLRNTRAATVATHH